MAAKQLYAQIGESQDYALLAGVGTERTVGIAVKPGNGTLERGTVMMMGTDGLYAPAVTAKFTGALAVLDETVESGDSATGIAPSVRAYSAGRFLKAKLKLAAGTLAAADLLEMRRQGILVEDMDGSVNNDVTGG